jgi:hypothetical protein
MMSDSSEGPWTKYQNTAPSSGGGDTGPWTKYQQQSAAAPAPSAPTPQPDDGTPDWLKSTMDVAGQALPGMGALQDPTVQKAVSNIPSSAANTVGSIYQAVRHPVDTATGLYNTAAGEAEKIAAANAEMMGASDKQANTVANPEHQLYADAFNKYFSDRYGSIEGFKKAATEDPVGVLTDLSAAFTGGGSAVAKGAGTIAKVGGTTGKIASTIARGGEIAANVGKKLNPIEAGLKSSGKIAKGAGLVADRAGHLAATAIGHLGTRTGAEPIVEAFKAGKAGGQAALKFLDNLRGRVPVAEVLKSAKQAVKLMRDERSAQYRTGKAGLAQNKRLTFNDLDAAIANTDKIKTFHGVDVSPKTAAVRAEIKDVIETWKTNAKTNPAFTTVEGFDALKQSIGEIRDAQEFGKPARKVADDAYHAVRETIINQEPHYGKIMADYEEASRTIEDLESSLSLGHKASVDTALRKLQSIMRDNVNTQFGRRKELGEVLAKHGATGLHPALAGQALNAEMPRGIGYFGAASSVGGAMSGHPAALAAFPLMSPRLVGEGAYRAGQLSGLAGKGSRAARRLTRVPRRYLGPAGLGAYELEQTSPDNMTP